MIVIATRNVPGKSREAILAAIVKVRARDGRASFAEPDLRQRRDTDAGGRIANPVEDAT